MLDKVNKFDILSEKENPEVGDDIFFVLEKNIFGFSGLLMEYGGEYYAYKREFQKDYYFDDENISGFFRLGTFSPSEYDLLIVKLNHEENSIIMEFDVKEASLIYSALAVCMKTVKNIVPKENAEVIKDIQEQLLDFLKKKQYEEFVRLYDVQPED